MKLLTWQPAYEDEAPAEDQTPPAGGTKTFTQEDLNKIVQAEKAKEKAKYQKQIQVMESLRDSLNLTKKEAEALTNQIEDMKRESMTKEELAKEDKERLSKQLGKDLKKAQDDSELWKQRYTSSTIERSIIDAAVEAKAYNPSQIVAILKANTRLIDEIDAEGKPSGSLAPRVTLKTKDADGKPTVLELTPIEAVKRLSEDEGYANLFVSDAKGGIGGYTTPRKADNGPIKDTAKYIEARRKNKK